MTDDKRTKQRVQNRDANATIRAAKAITLRSQKVKWVDIANVCGYGSPGAAHKAVMRELERTVVTNVEELRREELESLERLEFICWKRLQEKGFEKSMLFAVDRIISIKDRRARLMGLDVKVDGLMGPQIIIEEVPMGYLEGPLL